MMDLSKLFFTRIFHRRKRFINRLFQSRIILDMFKGRVSVRNLPPSLTEALLDTACQSPDILMQTLHACAAGLTEEEAEKIREKTGLNEVEYEKPLPWWMHLWLCYKNPFNLLLSALAIISFYTGDSKGTIVILFMVVLSVFMRFWQEMQSNQAADKLKSLVSNTATVFRRENALTEKDIRSQDISLQQSDKIELPINQLVPGDIIHLSAGDMIPADLRILAAKDLFVSQVAMTGETLPVEKFAKTHNEKTENPFELENILFMGTNVVSGTATAVVFNTGNQTYFGTIAMRVTSREHVATPFQIGINKVSWLLIRFMLVMVPIVFVLNGVTKNDWLQAFLFSLSIAVGLTPEMLPMIVTATLAKGAITMSRKQVIVKRLDAIQTFGAMNILCTDKTGTLTQDKIFLERYADVFGQESLLTLEFAYLNSFYQTGLKNLLDRAVLEHVEVKGEMGGLLHYHKVDEIPFDFVRRRMSVVVQKNHESPLLICKGAFEEVLKVCTTVQYNGNTQPLTEELLKKIYAFTAELNDDGLRVVAVATKYFPLQKTTYTVSDEQALSLLGYIAFLDPPKESTAPALKALKEHGVMVKVLTGDNERVTTKICHEVGIKTKTVVLGADIENMNDYELSQVVMREHVFAKLTPIHKERIVRMLRINGHIVGFMGDGINDAPALRAADIGISVDSAVDIAKEAADIILLEKSLMVLEGGVLEGRKTFANMLKYIKMTASSNFGNVFSVLVAGAFLPFLPMLPLQLLVQNLLYDISQTAIPFDNVDKPLLKKPLYWNPGNIGWFMICFGPISSIFDILTFALLWFYFGANSVASQTFFQSGWFVEGLLSQTLIVHMIRTRKIPFIQSCASWPLMMTTLIVMAIGIFLPMGMFADYFKMQALPLNYFPFLVVILIAYMLLTQMMKRFYSKWFSWQ